MGALASCLRGMKPFRAIENFLESPRKVLAACVLLMAATFLFDGSLYQLWSLSTQSRFLEESIESYRQKTEDLDEKIQQAQGVEFIERLAVDQLDLVAEGDLIFVFSDTSSPDSP